MPPLLVITSFTSFSIACFKKTSLNIYISELGIFDEDGELIIYKTFLKKGKDDDMLFDFLYKNLHIKKVLERSKALRS